MLSFLTAHISVVADRKRYGLYPPPCCDTATVHHMTAPLNDLQQEVANGMNSRDFLKALLKVRHGWGLQDLAVRLGKYVTHVSQVMAGERQSDEIRNGIAEHLEISRAELDLIIDGPETTSTVVAPGRAS